MNSRKKLARLLVLSLAGLLLAALPALANPGSAFEQVLEHYEDARQSLMHDSTDGVAEAGEEIARVLEHLEDDFSAEHAGVEASSEQLETLRELLPAIQQAAEALAISGDLTSARDAFYELSKPLVRWRKATGDEQPIVAYCSMSRRSWLQPEGELGNPYHGQSMLRCGEVVDG